MVRYDVEGMQMINEGGSLSPNFGVLRPTTITAQGFRRNIVHGTTPR